MSESLVSSQQAISVERWLKRHGFFANPFADQEANREKRLTEYFVETPYYDDVMGLPTNPRSIVVYAGRGSGKSAHRLMVAQACRPKSRSSSVLAVEYDSFGRLAEQIGAGSEIGGSLLRRHLAAIMERTVEALIGSLCSDPNLASSFPLERAGRLKYFWERYGVTVDDPSLYFGLLRSQCSRPLDFEWSAFRTAWHSEDLLSLIEGSCLRENSRAMLLAELVDVPSDRINETLLSVAALYELLVALVRSSRLEAVYVLVDRVDEAHALADRPDRVADMLTPLIGELPLLECPGAAFKFFIPDDVARILAERPGIRTDRILFRELHWQDEMMEELLSARLSYFSDGKIAALGELCEPDLAAEVDAKIVEFALGVPRNLLRLAEELILAHCSRSGETLLLSRSDWQEALARYHGTTSVPGLRAPTHPPLRLHPRTRTVTVGSRTVSLTEALFDLLWFMAQRPGKVVPNHKLWEFAGSHDALRSSVSRIRRQIEQDARKPDYLVTVRGEGMRLDNVLPAENAEETE